MDTIKPKVILEGSQVEGEKVIARGNTYKAKHWCPGCQKKRFVRFVDLRTYEYLPERFGRCDRENNCAYYLHPNEEDYTIGKPVKAPPKPPVIPKAPSFIKKALARSSIDLVGNKLYQFLISLFYEDEVASSFKEYGIGTDNLKWPGAPIFYQIDLEGSIRGGKVIDYADNGHRIKNHCGWIHSLWKLEGFNLVQCLFGLHLVRKYPNKSICVVESEKTALIAAIYYPQYVWLATGGLSNKPVEKCKALLGKRVTLIPDIGAYDKWEAVANELNQATEADFSVFHYLEAFSEQAEGYDIADFIEAMIQKGEYKTEQALTPKQKLEAMSRKNPKLSELVSKLGLSFRTS